ncbi:MAG: 2'-5' RNA ligase family protein [Gemmatimonadales bacterium]
MPIREIKPIDQQLELLSRDATWHNVFFAALPDATMSARAGDVARDVRRRLQLTATPIPPERLHVSLLSVGGFAGSCPPAVIDAAMRAAGTVSIAPFKVEFDRVASFSGSHGQRALVVTGDGDGVAGFMRLQDALKHALMKASLRLPRQSGYSPHLTMMYDENRTSDFAIEPIGWTVSRFVLIDSLVGQSRHVHLGQWSL